jgi:predicted Zn-dependent peptidase
VTAPGSAPATGAPPAPPRPGPGAPRAYQFPAFERRTLPNGLRLVVAPLHRLPVVSVAAVVDAGAATDPAGQEGLAVLTARALDEGTAAFDALALADRVERLGASLDAGADWDSAVVALTTLAPKLGDAFEVLAEVLARPAFPEREVERLRQERLADLLHVRSDPGALADVAFAEAVYGPASRFGRPEGGGRRPWAASRATPWPRSTPRATRRRPPRSSWPATSRPTRPRRWWRAR